MPSDSRHHPVLWRVLEFAAHLMAIMCILHVSRYLNLDHYARTYLESNPPKEGGDWLSRIFWNSLNWYSIVTALGLFAEGFVGGRFGKLPILVHYLALPFLFGGVAAIEMTVSPGTHNLFGIEVFFYFILFFPILVGGQLGRLTRGRIAKPPQRRGFPVEPLE